MSWSGSWNSDSWQYGIAPSAAITGAPNSLSGRVAASPSASDPQWHATIAANLVPEPVRGVHQRRGNRVPVWKGCGEVAVKPQHLPGAFQGTPRRRLPPSRAAESLD